MQYVNAIYRGHYSLMYRIYGYDIRSISLKPKKIIEKRDLKLSMFEHCNAAHLNCNFF